LPTSSRKASLLVAAENEDKTREAPLLLLMLLLCV